METRKKQQCSLDTWETYGLPSFIACKANIHIAGSGKSVLCSSAIEALIEKNVLAFFYFDFRNSAKQTVYGLLSSLVSQLGSCSLLCNRLLSAFYKKHGTTHHQGPTSNLLFQCLESILHALPAVYIVLDALDECPEATRSREMFSLLKKLIGIKDDGFHLLITSRPEQDIRQALSSHKRPSSHLSKQATYFVLDIGKTKQHADDIQQYISKEVLMMKDWASTVQRTVKESLATKADGMFLLASLQLQSLRHCAPIAISRAYKPCLLPFMRHTNGSLKKTLTPLASHLLYRFLNALPMLSGHCRLKS
ncbi:hypothetical protein BDP27DRAFT_208667 [Rhodocollybia butyracea]|uniref:Nephrocystin 3-like N-terminal domain-containing protein n=1 Tax=Rhodocollybia butyracea TaxID=206335 RepID=A0A9P5PE04_9AGAR|nr:hypothetical protein BDP27DRAFT_208667 [Rhodocollybia butyracea]